MKAIMLILTTLIAFSCCQPVERSETSSTPMVEEPVEVKNPIQLEKIYDYYYDDIDDESSYVEMYRFELKGMEYLHVQEYNGDGYGYVINLTKDSLMCAQMMGGKPLPVGASDDYQTDHQKWYNDN